MFAAANCFACHRFDNQGGIVGPDLTILSGRFSPRDILESIVEPSKVVSDQYAAVSIVMMDGRVVTGRIVNLAGDSLKINANMLEPNTQIGVDRRQIEEMFPSKISMMPEGLLNTLTENEILDLMAYLLSRGDARNPMFEKK
jgi:putative heme-binding domain-containing protein